MRPGDSDATMMMMQNPKREKVKVLVCNQYGQVGEIVAYVLTNSRDSYKDFMELAIVSQNGIVNKINLAYDVTDHKDLNTFYALKIRDYKTGKILYKNPNASLIVDCNSYAQQVKDGKHKEWLESANTKFLLANIGQMVTISYGDIKKSGIMYAVTESSEGSVAQLLINKYCVSLTNVPESAKISVSLNKGKQVPKEFQQNIELSFDK